MSAPGDTKAPVVTHSFSALASEGVGGERVGRPGTASRRCRRDSLDASTAGDHRVNDPVVLEEHREAAVVPACDRRLVRSAAHRGMAGDRRAEVLLDFAHGAAALGAIELRLTHLHLVVHHERFGECTAGGSATAQERRENSGLHETLLQLPRDYSTGGNLSKRAG